MNFGEKESPFDIHEFDIVEDDERQNPEAHVRIPQAQQEGHRAKSRKEKDKPSSSSKPKSFNWAFFLAFLFFGLAATVTLHTPGALFVGMGIGFLFFVDPIYERVMSLFQRND